jgi:hypothetical protein
MINEIFIARTTQNINHLTLTRRGVHMREGQYLILLRFERSLDLALGDGIANFRLYLVYFGAISLKAASYNVRRDVDLSIDQYAAPIFKTISKITTVEDKGVITWFH